MAEGPEDSINQMLDSTSKDDDVIESSSEGTAARDERRVSTNTEMTVTSWNETLASKLGNGDCFHNPENLVQFVVSGKYTRE